MLHHELTHVVRNDFPRRLLAKIVGAFYWYHPRMWLASRRIAQLREAVCDRYCVSVLDNPDRYVDVLIATAQRLAKRRRLKLGVA